MTVGAGVTVVPRDVCCDEPAEYVDALERYLTTLSLTQAGPVMFSVTLTPDATAALRDTLRAGRRIRETSERLEAIQADLVHRWQERERAARRELLIWAASAIFVWSWTIWMLGS